MARMTVTTVAAAAALALLGAGCAASAPKTPAPSAPQPAASASIDAVANAGDQDLSAANADDFAPTSLDDVEQAADASAPVDQTAQGMDATLDVNANDFSGSGLSNSSLGL